MKHILAILTALLLAPLAALHAAALAADPVRVSAVTLGIAAGIAAAHAISEKVAVQAIDFPRYRRALLDAGQVLELSDTEINAASWNSRAEWNHAKPGYGWVFDAIDEDNDDRVSPDEDHEFQAFKQKHKDWEELLKAKVGKK